MLAPDLDRVAELCRAEALRVYTVDVPLADVRAFMEGLLLGRYWGCWKEGLITHAEARDVLVARFYTWLTVRTGQPEPDAATGDWIEFANALARASYGVEWHEPAQ